MKVLNEENFDDAIKNEKLVVVDFWADWCMPCKMLTPILEKLEEEFKDVVFAKVNTDENPNLAFKFGIFSIPTVIMFYKGEIVNSFIGAMPESFVRTEIEKALKKVMEV